VVLALVDAVAALVSGAGAVVAAVAVEFPVVALLAAAAELAGAVIVAVEPFVAPHSAVAGPDVVVAVAAGFVAVVALALSAVVVHPSVGTPASVLFAAVVGSASPATCAQDLNLTHVPVP